MNAFIKLILTQIIILSLLGVSYYLYKNYDAFFTEEIRCEGKNLSYPETFSDCVDCHSIKTPEIVDNWYESKHGVMLVKCGTCHGDPSGKGELAFSAKPDPIKVCARCHGPAVDRMQQKHSEIKDCVTCHPYHQNPIHRNAYQRITDPKTPTY